MAQQETQKRKDITGEKNAVHEVEILPETQPDQLAGLLINYIGYTMLLYNGNAEHDLEIKIPDHKFGRMMESSHHIGRLDAAEDVASKLLALRTSRVVFIEPNHT